MIKTAFLFRRFGPYHHARLRALTRDIEVVGIEMSAADATYAWAAELPSQSFRQITLFRDRDVSHERGGEIIERVRDALDRIRPAVVAIPGWADRGALAALCWCIDRGSPAVLMTDSSALDAPRVGWRVGWKEAIKRRVVRLCSAGFVAGAPHKDYVSQLGMPRERIFMGYDAVDNDCFWRGACEARVNEAAERDRLSLPKRFFLASSRFVAKKNLATLLRAYARYRTVSAQEPWKLVILGDGDLRDELERICAELQLQDAVLMPGFKQYGELPSYYGLAGAFVHASTVEQWGLVVNEAMAAGLPVLVSRRCGCAADLVEDNVNGNQFDPSDHEMLASLLSKIAGLSDEQRAEMGEASRRIISRWSLATFEENAVSAVRAALSAPARTARSYDRWMLKALIRFGDKS
jgi:1,2-diacylglycerol 3-alpha-glucosyltransferase